MKYCSDCGHAVTRQWIAADARERYVCTLCGMTHYQNPRIIVSCAVCWRDQILMCRRSQEPARGQWTVPTGFLECGETLEEGAARETFEETGVVLDPASLSLYSIVNLPAIQQVLISFRLVCATKPSVRPGPECLEAAFLCEAEIPLELFAWRTVMGNRPKRFFEEVRSGQFTIQQITIGALPQESFASREYVIRSITTTTEPGN
jgi:ADP-ribose pyrophosphatase YjhB (NUDIX family)